MTTEERAQEISDSFYMSDTGFNRENLYDAAIAMAEWKKQQMIDRTCEFITEWFCEHPHTTKMVCSDEFKNIDDLINRLRKAMEEQQ